MKSSERIARSAPATGGRHPARGAGGGLMLLAVALAAAGCDARELTEAHAAAEAAVAPAPDDEATRELEKQGKRLFLLGQSPTAREITALFGPGRTAVPASALPCVSCHGFDGRGVPEGGVTPSNITWQNLTKPYGLKHQSGREHPAYTERSLRTAITQGLDPAGNQLSTTMPTYQLTHEEVSALVAYLKRVGTIRDPGLDQRTIHLGALLPGEPGSPAAASVRSVLEAFFADLNHGGGVHGRQVVLEFVHAGDGPAASLAAARRLVEEEPVFALASAYLEGAEDELVALVGEEEVPLVGAVTNRPRVGFPLNRYVFYLASGVREQAVAMVDFAASRSSDAPRRAAVVWPRGAELEDVVEAVEARCAEAGWEPPTSVAYAPAELDARTVADQLSAAGVELVFLLGAGEAQVELARAAEALEWRPELFVPGASADSRLLSTAAGQEGRVYLSFPRGPADQTPEGVAEFVAFAREHGLPSAHLDEQVAAYCTAEILAEALKRAGRDVSREKLTRCLEGLYEFETGLMPPLTYGPNRRIGAKGAYVAGIDRRTRRITPVSDWIDVD